MIYCTMVLLKLALILLFMVMFQAKTIQIFKVDQVEPVCQILTDTVCL